MYEIMESSCPCYLCNNILRKMMLNEFCEHRKVFMCSMKLSCKMSK